MIPPECVDALRQTGKWLEVNGESVYGTGPSPFEVRWETDIDACTVKPGRCYLHVFKWPGDRRLYIRDFRRKKLVRAYLLADKERTPLAADHYSQSIMLHLPPSAPDPVDSVVVVEWEQQ